MGFVGDHPTCLAISSLNAPRRLSRITMPPLNPWIVSLMYRTKNVKYVTSLDCAAKPRKGNSIRRYVCWKRKLVSQEVKLHCFAQCTNYWIKSRCSDVNFHSWIQSCDRCLGRARNYENNIVSKTSVFASFSIVQPKTKNSKSIRILRLQYKLN